MIILSRVFFTVLSFSMLMSLGVADASESYGRNTASERDADNDGEWERRRPRKKKRMSRDDYSEERTSEGYSRKRKSHEFWTVGLGPGAGTGAESLVYNFSVGRHWEASTKGEIAATVDASFADDGSATYGIALIGGSYLPSEKEMSLLVGGGFGLGVVGGNNVEETGGFAAGVHVGARFFRHSTTQMEAKVKYALVFGEDSPGVGSLQLSILF